MSTIRIAALAALFCLSTAERIAFIIPDPRADEVEDGLTKRSVSGALLGGMNFADPSILQIGDESYAYATAGNGKHIQMASSNNFNDPSSWQYVNSDALPQVPSWVEKGEVWAPQIVHLTDYDNSFGLYYSGRTTVNGKDVHCLGLARNGNDPLGSFSDGSTEPWFINQGIKDGCQEDMGGQIDPSIFRDADGSWYVTYKLDGPRTCPDGPACKSTPLYLHKLGTNSEGKVDGYTLSKDEPWPLKLFDNNGADDEYNIEAPSIVMSNDGKTHFMFFSRGQYYDSSYKVSYTYSTNGIQGPWNNPRKDLLVTGSTVVGELIGEHTGPTPELMPLYAPGGADVTLLGANMVFHADYNSKDGSVRAMHTGHLNWLKNYEVGVA